MPLPQKSAIDVRRMTPSLVPGLRRAVGLWDRRWETLPIAMYACDAAGRIAGFNALAAKIWGRKPRIGDPVKRYCGSVRLYMDGRPVRHDQCPMAQVLRTGAPVDGSEVTVERADGSRSVVRAHIDPVRDGGGNIVGAIGCLQDITERKRAEAQQRALLDEVNHRVKNTLSTVQSLARFTLRDARVPAEVREAFLGRLMALSSVHNQLARERWEAADLRRVLQDILEPYRDDASHRQGSRIVLDGPPVRIGAKAALTLSLVLHELVTNAIQHGALSHPDGALRVAWAVASDGERCLRIEWRESGGPPVRPPERSGFGRRLLERSIARELKGSVALSFAPAGFACTIDLPLPDRP